MSNGIKAIVAAAVAGVVALLASLRPKSTIPSVMPPAGEEAKRLRVVNAGLADFARVNALATPVDPQEYWDEAAPGVHVQKGTDWCGGWFVAMIKRAGFGAKSFWNFNGTGIGKSVTPTTSPKPGDLAYFHKNQHHAMVERVDGNTIHLLNGNGGGKGITRTSVPRSSVAGFFSIAKMLDQPATTDEVFA